MTPSSLELALPAPPHVDILNVVKHEFLWSYV